MVVGAIAARRAPIRVDGRSGLVQQLVAKPEVRALPALRVFAVTDLEGVLEPCGCESRPAGGLDRLAALLGRSREAGVPTAVLLAGDLFFGADRPERGDVPTQAVWSAETLADVLEHFGVTAATPGWHDLSQGAERLAALSGRVHFPLLAASLVDKEPGSVPGQRSAAAFATAPVDAMKASTVITVGSLRLGLVGIVIPRVGDGRAAIGLPTEPWAVAARHAKDLRARGAELVFALVTGGVPGSDRIAAEGGVDFVVQGGVDDGQHGISRATPGGAVVVRASHRGQGVTVLEVWPSSATASRQPPSATVLPSGQSVDARYQELSLEQPRDVSVTKTLEALTARVNSYNAQAYASEVSRPVPAGKAGYVGSRPCASCHTRAYVFWTGTPHARAYRTLVARQKQFNLDCVGCHVTGFGEPGGSSVVSVEYLENVGCESCHGPGSLHIDRPRSKVGALKREVAPAVCGHCHDPDHSDSFQYDRYRALVIGSGHGLK